MLITIDGPGGVGKSTAAAAVVELLNAAGMATHATVQPSRKPLGELARHGTDIYDGMALACLCAADRHHQLKTEIVPALRQHKIVVCDRYLASSLVLQGLDGIPSHLVWQLNHGIYQPDLAVILNAAPEIIDARLRSRGGYSRFERDEDNSWKESELYAQAVTDLHRRGWLVRAMDSTNESPEHLAGTIMSLIEQALTEGQRGRSCR